MADSTTTLSKTHSVPKRVGPEAAQKYKLHSCEQKDSLYEHVIYKLCDISFILYVNIYAMSIMVAIQVPGYPLSPLARLFVYCCVLCGLQTAQTVAIHILARRYRRRGFKPNKEGF